MTFLYIVIGLVLIFDFINGFHDSANSIATIVSTKVLTPFKAVLMAAFFNFVAFLIFNLHVATTMGKGVINPDVVNLTVIASAGGFFDIFSNNFFISISYCIFVSSN